MQNWGIAGFHAHTAKVADFYRQRRDVFQQAAAKHLTGLAEWTVPSAGTGAPLTLSRRRHGTSGLIHAAAFPPRRRVLGVGPGAGMFFWIKLLGTTDSMALIKNKAVERKFLMVPGQVVFGRHAPSARGCLLGR